jgi:hypothetical protein
MKKFLPYILIVLIFVQLLAPFTVGLGIKNDLEIQNNKAEAEDEWDTLENFKNAFKESILSQNGSITNQEAGTSSVDFHIKIDTGIAMGEDASMIWRRTDFPNGIPGTNPDHQFRDKDFVLVFKDSNNANKTGFYDVTSVLLGGSCTNCNGESLMNMRMSPSMPVSVESDIAIKELTPVNGGVSTLMAGSEYTVTLYYQAVTGDLLYTYTSNDKGEDILGDNDPDYFPITTPITFSTATVEQGFLGSTGSGEVKINEGVSSILPECPWDFWSHLDGCFARVLYFALFKTTSFVFGLTGQILDFTLMYSISDTSYRSGFVVQGWGIVRDFCNMFFIFVLLYIAFGTILKLNGVKTKEMIINVVIIGLLINFSLFATQIIIDASNILTRVFYNQNTIVTGTQKDADGKIISELGEFGEIKLSVAIVSKVNPVTLIMKAGKVDDIDIKTGVNENGEKETTKGGISTGGFILVVILATIVNIVGIIAFSSCFIIFISRVLGLWLAMILAPLAFFSYTIPQMQDMKMIGWKHWWPETLKMAFLAPVFAFFMYLIVGFMDKGLDIVNADSKTGMNFVVAMIVPFVFIMLLLMQAKKIAVNMSGEVGAALSKAGAAVGGLALAAGTGGAAMAMRGTVGKAGSALSNSTWVNKMAGSKNLFSKFAGNKLKDVGQNVGKSSFDIRKTQAGAAASKGLGVDMSGKGSGLGLAQVKEGGYVKDREDKVKRKQKRAQEIKVNEDEKLTQDVNKLEMDLQSLLNKNAHELEALDKRITVARQDATDINSKETTDPIKVAAKKLALATASAMVTITPADIARKTAAIATANAMDVDDIVKVQAKKDVNDKVTELKENKKAIKSGGSYTETALTAAPGTIPRGAVSYAGNVINGRTIDDLEITAIPDAHAEKQKESRRRTTNYANNTARWWWRSNTNKEAKHKIIMEDKLDSGTKT